MKVWIVATLVASLALAGCSGKEDPLDPYLVAPSETPDSCYFWQPDEEAAFYLAAIGFDSNPGSFASQYLTMGNVTPVANRGEVFECKFGSETALITSVAGRFDDSRAATDWVLAAQADAEDFLPFACTDQVHVFVDGAVVGGIGTDSRHPVVKQALDIAFARILQETGAKEYCPT